MRDEITKRINEVRCGRVPEGYQRVNGHIMPETWHMVPLCSKFDRSLKKNDSACNNVLTISAQLGLVSQSEYYYKDIASDDKSGYFLIEKGEFAYNKSYSSGYPYGAIKRLENFEQGIVSPLYICFTPKEGVNADFYAQYFESRLFNREIYHFAQEGARNHGLLNISVDDFFEGNLPAPSEQEQQRIAEILYACDREIEMKQKLVEELQSLKKTCLAKMFPREGSDVPELRFPGFTAPWEQRKLGDVLQTLPFKAYLKSPEQDGRYEIIQQGSDPIIGYANGEPCKDYKNTVIFGDHTLSLYKPKKPFFVATDGVRIVKGFENMDGNYLLSLLERNKPQSEGYKRYYSILADIDVFFTENHEEQSKIGEYFSELDDLITLHQRELEAEQQKKKALMQLLLTGLVRVNQSTSA